MFFLLFLLSLLTAVLAEPILEFNFDNCEIPEKAVLNVSEKFAEKLKDQTLFVNGLSSPAFRCGGFSQYGYFLSTPNPFSMQKSSPFTLTCWFKSYGGYLLSLIYFAPRWESPEGFVILQNGAQIALKVGNKYVIKTEKDNPFQLNRWYFLALSWNGKKWSLFLNGITYFSGINMPFLLPDKRCMLNVGGYNLRTNNIFQGLIDEVKIYQRVLPETELFEIIDQKISEIR